MKSLYPYPLPRMAPHVARVNAPDPGLVAGLHPPAGQVVTAMLTILEEARAAERAVHDGRPEGAAWMAAAAADRQAVIAGKPPTALAEVIAGEPDRYATAVATVTTAGTRWDHARAAGQKHLDAAAKAATAALGDLLTTIASTAATAWDHRGTAAGMAAAEQLDVDLDRAQQLAAVRDWCAGHDRALDPNAAKYLALTPVTRGHLVAVRDWRSGGQTLARDPEQVVLPPDYPDPGGASARAGYRRR